MATFSYEARDTAGKTVSGLIEAAEARGAAGALREQGLFATRIVPMGRAAETNASVTATVPNGRVGAQTKTDIAPFLVSVPLPALAAMYRQFATLMHAGVPIAQALTTLAQQSSNPRLRSLLSECGQAVMSGLPLTTVMERHPSTFTGVQTELIRAGETSGMLDVMASRIADYLEREIEIRRRLKRETLYPKIVLFVAWCVGGLLFFLGKNPPGGYFGASALLVGTSFALWWLARYLNQYPWFGETWDYVKMLVPGVGGVARRYATARFTRALGALYGGGVNLSRAVEGAARACGNRAIGQRLLDAAPALNHGNGLTGVLEASGLLSPMAITMARTGEQTGSLDAMMDKVADYLESEADSRSHQLAVFAGVGALLLAGLVVGYIAISFYGGHFGGMMKTGE